MVYAPRFLFNIFIRAQGSEQEEEDSYISIEANHNDKTGGGV